MKTDWFRQARYGLIVHYLSGWNDLHGPWDAVVSRFDPHRFADDCARTGAGYLMFTLGQGRGVYAAPNAHYDARLACANLPARSPSRDLPGEFIPALQARGLRPMLYFVADPSWDDPASLAVMNPENSPSSRTRQQAVVGMAREWSLRYGASVGGWWIDGFGNVDWSEPEKWELAEALKAGNPEALTAFNGNDMRVRKMGDYEDYTAGECHSIGALPASAHSPDDIQWHAMTHLGETWGDGGLRFRADDLSAWIRSTNERGGVCTLDVQILADGSLNPAQVERLGNVSKKLRMPERAKGGVAS